MSVTITETRSQLSWLELPKLFVTSFFEPYIEDGWNQMQQVREKGLLGYTWSFFQGVGSAVKNDPLEVATFAMAVTCGETASVALLTTCVARNVLLITRVSRSEGKSMEKAVQVAFYGGMALYLLSSIPVAYAAEYNSLSEAKAAFPGRGCEADLKEILTPPQKCLLEGGSLSECRSLVTRGEENDFYLFTRHPTSGELDPVSIVKLHDDKTCILTALDSTSDVTKTCFVGSDLSTRTVEGVVGMSLSSAHKGLEAGQSVQHVGIFLGSSGCGYFRQVGAKFDLGDQPLCLLTSLKTGGQVSQMCFDPAHPESLVLKPAPEGILLEGDAPVSVVIKNPDQFGLNIKPDQPEVCEVVEETCTAAEGITLFEALRWWWNGKPPCGGAS